MTIKKIALSAVAMAMVSSVALAAGTGTLTLNGGIGKFSNELISNTSVDKNNTTQLDYTCGIVNASASTPGFELKLVSPAIIKSSSDVSGAFGIYKKDDNTSIATFDRYDSTAHSIIFKAAANASISRGVEYVIGDSNTSAPVAGEMEMTVTKGSTSVNAELIVTDNTGTTNLDTVNTVVMNGADQFAMSIDTPFSAEIDASKAFKEFYGSSTASSATTDAIVYTIANNRSAMTSGIFATATDTRLNIVADQNLTTYKITQATAGGTKIDTINLSDYNLTAYASAPDNNFSEQLTTTYTTDKAGAMSVTHFKATGVVAFDGFSKTLLSKVDAGSWTIYGYSAQIPNVVSIPSADVTLKFTNRSSLDAQIYFTLIDQDGTVVTLNSVDNPSLAALPANTTGKYLASDLVTLIKNGDAKTTSAVGTIAGFNTAGSFSVEVSIPTTPTSVYGYASFHSSAGNYKDLPIYNTSSMTY